MREGPAVASLMGAGAFEGRYAERYCRKNARYRSGSSAGRIRRGEANAAANASFGPQMQRSSASARRIASRAKSETLRFARTPRRVDGSFVGRTGGRSGGGVGGRARSGVEQARCRRRRLSGRACAAALVVLLGAGLCLNGPFGKLVSGPSGGESTPVTQWKKGETPLLLQTDPAWAEAPYAGSTVAESGCGPTCLTMAYVFLTGKKDYDPASMCALSEREGYVDSGMTSWGLMNEGVRLLGLTSRELPADAVAVRDALSAGSLVIASVGPGDFTTTGHFIVLAGADDSGRFVIRDPNSAGRSAKAWDAQQVLSQCRNLWAVGC